MTLEHVPNAMVNCSVEVVDDCIYLSDETGITHCYFWCVLIPTGMDERSVQ